nr:AMP-dependent synthetase ligase and Peptidase M12A domain containing protein [Haemonchus contortus]
MMAKASPKALVDNLLNLNINVSHITPAMVMWLAMDITLETQQINSLRSILVAGAPIDANLANHAKRKMHLKDLRQSYGMTELGGLCTLSPYESDKIESIVNYETKQLCPPRTPGHLLVNGPQVAPCYYKNAKATAEIIDSNGYVKTGDAAFYDETGNIYVLDRMKDIIKYKGTLVCPSEVELTLRGHPGIDDCAVVGRQDHVSGEVPAAFVVKNPAFPLLSSAEVRQYVSGKIPTFKELRGGVFFVPEIPRSICGKVLRRQLRQFWDRERTNSKDVIAKDGKTGKTPEKSDKQALKKANVNEPHNTRKGSLYGESFSVTFNGIQRNAVRQTYLKWADGRIPYTISSQYSSSYSRSKIAEAIEEYRKKTCIDFSPKSAADQDYIHIVPDDGCYSLVGRIGGKQPVSLGDGCIQKGIIIHELMHAVGFFHEQSRADRDDHVIINWNNVESGLQDQFDKYSLNMVNHLDTNYDYGSVMHYAPTAFSKFHLKANCFSYSRRRVLTGVPTASSFPVPVTANPNLAKILCGNIVPRVAIPVINPYPVQLLLRQTVKTHDYGVSDGQAVECVHSRCLKNT